MMANDPSNTESFARNSMTPHCEEPGVKHLYMNDWFPTKGLLRSIRNDGSLGLLRDRQY